MGWYKLSEIHKGKYQVLHLQNKDPVQEHKAGERAGGVNLFGKALGRLVGSRLDIRHQFVLAAKKASSIPSCGNRTTIRKWIFPSNQPLLEDHI